MKNSLEFLIKPRSVAVIGASDEPGRIGGRPIHYSKSNGYAGQIYPVNPNRETVQGMPSFKSIRDVPEAVDCAVIAVPAAIVADTLVDCAAAGVRSAVIFSSGFAELGEQGAAIQQQVSQIAADSGMRVLGPNCLGVFNVASAWFGTFANAPSGVKFSGGGTGIVSQSGAYGSHVFIASQQRGVRSNYWVTTGNECDVGVAEVINYYAQSDDVNVIVAYVESVKDGPMMRTALANARAAGKPVIIMKVGNSDVGAKAALSHTASIVGSDDVYDALFRQYGVHRAHTTRELVDLAYVCQFGKFPSGKKICLQSISGGAGIQMADVAIDESLDVVPLVPAVQARLKKLIPQAGVMNPVDFTANALNDPKLMEQNLRITLSECDFDSHVVYLTSTPANPFTREATLAVFSNIRREFPDEVIVASMLVPDEVSADYEALGIPCFEDPAIAVRAVGALTRLGESFARSEQVPAAGKGELKLPAIALGEMQAKQLLADAGLPVTREALATSAEQALEVWKNMGTPVVLKIASADIAHKTEIGGVMVNLNTADAIADGYDTLISRAQTHAPQARLDGVIVSQMITGGVETVVGVVRDPVFGPAIMFGLGGILVEILKDVSFRLAPFGVDEAHRMIDEIRGRAVLDGVRGAPPCDVQALAETISRLSVFAAENANTIDTIDINPLMVLADGVCAVDALIVPVSLSGSEQPVAG